MSLEDVVRAVTHSTRIRCPECADTRKGSNKTQRTMGVTVEQDRNVYQCFHCEAKGAVSTVKQDTFRRTVVQQNSVPKEAPRPVDPPASVDDAIVESFLKSRGIDPSLVKHYPLVGSQRYFGDSGKCDSIGFLYGDPRKPQAIKWRNIAKKEFTQQGAARSFFGLDQLPSGTSDLIICEGEMDVLALAAAGIPAIGVPNGAPQKVSDGTFDPEEDGKFSYVWDSRDLINSAERIIFFPDNDTAGTALVEELARRIGRAKCWTVTLPEKDANETLVKHGALALKEALMTAKPMPLEGVYLPEDFETKILELYNNGTVRGESTGLTTLDPFYTMLGGQLTVCTGLPGSGKSELIDQICLNIAMNKGWRFAYASFENPPAMHIAKLAEKVVGKPFFEGAKNDAGVPVERMSNDERDYALDFLNKHFVFLQSHDGTPPTVQSIIERTKQAVMRIGVRGLIIDPYNYIDMGGDNEHQSISKMLTDVILFCQSHQLHCVFIAHPSKQAPDSGVPKGQHISGSAAWFAKCDMGVTVHRRGNNTEVHVWKSRFKWVGKLGMVNLNYDIPTGRYSDIADGTDGYDWDFPLDD
jgi:twinkle protein